MTTIFIAVKHNDAVDMRILLLFLENEEDLNSWIKIEEKYMEGKLLDNCRDYGDPKTKQKSLFLYNFKPLYSQHTEDINYMVPLVETEVMLMKGTKEKGWKKIQQLPTLFDVGAWEKLVKIIKNKLMC